MRNPKETEITYDDLLNVITSLKIEAKQYREVGMNRVADDIMATRKKFQKIKRSCKLTYLKIKY